MALSAVEVSSSSLRERERERVRTCVFLGVSLCVCVCAFTRVSSRQSLNSLHYRGMTIMRIGLSKANVCLLVAADAALAVAIARPGRQPVSRSSINPPPHITFAALRPIFASGNDISSASKPCVSLKPALPSLLSGLTFKLRANQNH